MEVLTKEEAAAKFGDIETRELPDRWDGWDVMDAMEVGQVLVVEAADYPHKTRLSTAVRGHYNKQPGGKQYTTRKKGDRHFVTRIA